LNRGVRRVSEELSEAHTADKIHKTPRSSSASLWEETASVKAIESPDPNPEWIEAACIIPYTPLLV
jgi:hypothetical protein